LTEAQIATGGPQGVAGADGWLTIRVRRSTAAVSMLVAVIVLPSLVWCLYDRSVWAWDQSSYGDASLLLWSARRSGAWSWLQAMAHALASAPPLIVWLGQLFLPLRHLTGQFESALLLLNIAADVVILCLVNAITRDLDGRLTDRMAAIMACGGSGIVIALCHEFLAETVVCAAAAFTMYACLKADRVSVLRSAALLTYAVSIGLLAKAASGLFLAPLLAYAAISSFLARDRPRPSASRFDAALAAFACFLALATIIWYAVNWPYVLERVINATIAKEVVLNYGSPVELGKKIRYWVPWLGLSISSFAWMSVTFAAVISSAIFMTLRRSYDRAASRWIRRTWEDGTLFAVVLAGSVVATIVAFSLQINEDIRFLITTTPMVAVLLGWSLSVLRARLLSVIIIGCLAFNTAVNHLLSDGVNPLHAPFYGYLHPPDLSGLDRKLLIEAIGGTCPPDVGDRWSIVAVSYRTLNANSASFYSAQKTFDLDRRCRYGGLVFAPTDFDAAIDKINAVAPPFVVTVDTARQPPADFVNLLSKPVAEWLARNAKFVPQLRLENGFVVYRERTP